MSAAGEWFVTPHAVEAYIQRFEPRMTYEQALTSLIGMSSTARYIKTYEVREGSIRGGLELWRGPKPFRLRFWVGRDNDGLPQLVTVIGGFDEWRYRDG